METTTSISSSSRLLQSQHSSTTFRKKVNMSLLKMRYRNTRKCVSSQAGLLVLLWSFIVHFLFLIIRYFKIFIPYQLRHYSSIGFSGFNAMFFLTYPIVGHLADTKFGRYRVLVAGLWILVPAAILEIIAIVALGLILPRAVEVPTFQLHSATFVLGTMSALAALILLVIGTSAYHANAIQFGLDQLHDSPAEDQSLFIHWYLWVFCASKIIMKLALSGVEQHSDPTYALGYVVTVLILTCATLALLISMCYACRNKHFFLVQPSWPSPYKLVYLVTKFACKYKRPLNRSAFTYCEDEIPTGLDLGKEKYGGPFTTEQVEDVKAFYGILKILLIVGSMYIIESSSIMSKTAYSNTIYVSDKHPYFTTSDGDNDYTVYLKELLIYDGALYYLLILLCLPLYIFAIRPLVQNWIPSMLRRIGFGLIILFISMVLTWIIGNLSSLVKCTYEITGNATVLQEKNIDLEYLLILPEILNAIFHMLFYVAVYEFICSQSPSSMKGVLIGLSYSIRGLFQLLGLCLHFIQNKHVKVKLEYYLVTVMVGVIFLLVYRHVAKNYKYRVRDEFCNIHQFAEEYYSKIGPA